MLRILAGAMALGLATLGFATVASARSATASSVANDAAPAPVLVRSLEGRYEQRRIEDGGAVGVEQFRLSAYADGSRSLAMWNDLRERGSQMSVTLSVGPDFRAREAYARYWTAGKYRGSALVRVDGARVTLASTSANGTPGSVEAEAPARLSIGTHPASADGWHVAAMQLDGADGAKGTARSFSLNPGGDPASPLLGKLVDIPIERVGRERIEVPAGSFDALHVKLAGVSDYWIAGDDWIVVKARLRNREYVLVELRDGAAKSVAGFQAGPTYREGRLELEAAMRDMLAWLPGEWSSFPQVWHERTVQMPPDGEHEDWYRTFARIDAPQIGEYVFYGQINVGGRSGPLYPRSQVIYKATIDEQAGVIRIRGQMPAEADKFVNLQDRPELWKQVRMRDEAAVRCDFIWRRQGTQLFGVLEGGTPERRKYGPRTCSYVSERGDEFLADAEWVLAPDDLWLYDVNFLGGTQFIGRTDRTHTRLYRARPYSCEIRDSRGMRTLDAYDRGYTTEVVSSGGRRLQLMLLRAPYAAASGFGLDDRLRLTLAQPDAKPGEFVAVADAAPTAATIAVSVPGVQATCRPAAKFGPLPRGD